MVVNPVVLCSEVGVGDRGRNLWGNQLDAPLTPVSVPQDPDRTKKQRFLKKIHNNAQRVFEKTGRVLEREFRRQEVATMNGLCCCEERC